MQLGPSRSPSLGREIMTVCRGCSVADAVVRSERAKDVKALPGGASSRCRITSQWVMRQWPR
jgi:hypothetical protein